MKKQFKVIRRPVKNAPDAAIFSDELRTATECGFTLESCGVNGEGGGQAWAILSKPIEAPPEDINMVEAARRIATFCRGNDGCEGCPLSRSNQCLASGGRGGVIPGWWAIMGE